MELKLCHEPDHVEHMKVLASEAQGSVDVLDKLQAKSLYVCEDTNEAALISAGSCLQVGKI
jgi:acetoin utilization deacetylase AcuC-like enzyme